MPHTGTKRKRKRRKDTTIPVREGAPKTAATQTRLSKGTVTEQLLGEARSKRMAATRRRANKQGSKQQESAAQSEVLRLANVVKKRKKKRVK